MFASSKLLEIIRSEIEQEIAKEQLTGAEKEKHSLEKDLNKIE
jgi:sRNA-binding carbon storage regulator CsrA